ncbi:MAG: SDR family oxidoreductase [Pseudomonadota bacterium]
MELTGARILLTGASGGLGQALARALAEAGADLFLLGRDAERLAALVQDLAGTGARLHCLAVDLNQPGTVEQVAEAARLFGINVLVNNAGINAFGLYAEQDWRQAEAVLATNLLVPMALVRALLPWLSRQPAAAILNVGSTFGSLPFPGFAAYSAAKAGLRGFSQALRRELADSRVEVVYVAPRAIRTPLNSAAVNALNRELGSKEDSPALAARRIVAALAAGRAETHLGFPEALFARLNGALPRLIDRALAGKLPSIRRHAGADRPLPAEPLSQPLTQPARSLP